MCGTIGVTCYRTSAVSAGFIGRRLVDFDKVILPNAILRPAAYIRFIFRKQATWYIPCRNSGTLDCLADSQRQIEGAGRRRSS
jgi:hypothetical protein